MREFTHWEIVHTANGKFIGAVEEDKGDVVALNPAFELHSELVPQPVGPGQVMHVRIKVVQAHHSGSSTCRVTCKWTSRLRVALMTKDDQQEIETMLRKAEQMAEKAKGRHEPPSAILRPA